MTRGDHRNQHKAVRYDASAFALTQKVFSRLFVIVFILTSLSFVSACSLFETKDPSPRGQAPAPGTVQTYEPENQKSQAMEAFRAMAKPEGLNFTPLFSQPLEDEVARIQRLEREVQTLRNDLDTVVPSLVRLVAIEQDMKDLVGELKTITDGPSAAAPIQPVQQQRMPIPGEDVAGSTEAVDTVWSVDAGNATIPSPVTPEAAPEGQLPPEGAASPNSAVSSTPIPLTTPPVPQEAPAVQSQPQPAPTPAPQPVEPPTPPPVENQSAPQQQSDAGDVLDVRIGDHDDKARIVLDMTDEVNFKTNITNNGMQLVIDLNGMAWKGKPSWEAKNAKLVYKWRHENGKLYIDLLGVSDIKQKMVLPALNGNGYRFVLDLFCDVIHNAG